MAKGRAIVPETRPPAKNPSAKSAGARKGERKAAKRWLPWAGGIVAAIVVIVGLVLIVQANTASANAPGERIPVLGRDHIQPGTPHDPYNSDPPTSGPHYPEPVAAGFYDTPQADEYLVHNLEHGHIWIAYDCSKLTNCDEVKAQIKALIGSYNNWKIVATPRKNKDAAIAVAAWGWLEKMNTYDEAGIRKFVDAWRDKGPEQTME